MLFICDIVWRQREVLDEWRKAITVPMHKGKGRTNECNNYKGLSFLSVPGRVYEIVLT